MSCTDIGGCGSGGCSGCSKDSTGNGHRAGINSIVELEIHYSEADEQEKPSLVLRDVYCLTNIQTRELRVTGLEGMGFGSLDEMLRQIMACLRSSEGLCCGSINNIDVSYLKDDI